MPEFTYLNIDLQIERSGDNYRVQVINSPAGQASQAFTLPFQPFELDNFLLRLGHTRHRVRRIDSPEVEAAKTFGSRLFKAVFDGEVRDCLRVSLDEARRNDAQLRIRLRLSSVPELASLPWEYLYEPTVNRFLALSINTPLVRYLDLPERVRPLKVKSPLRVLTMISNPVDVVHLDVEREWTKLREALGDLERRNLVVLERLEQATLRALQRQLRREHYHIFHFVGHGGFDYSAQDGLLVLESEQGRGTYISGQHLGTILHDHDSLRLVVVNACEGARAANDDPFAGTAQSLVQQGIPAVVAMQFEITDDATITFAQEFYGAIADNYPVDAAVSEARKLIFTQGNGLEWAAPVLFMRSPDGFIFDMDTSTGSLRPDSKPLFSSPADAAVAGSEDTTTTSTEGDLGIQRGWWILAAIIATVVLMVFLVPRNRTSTGGTSSTPLSSSDNSLVSSAPETGDTSSIALSTPITSTIAPSPSLGSEPNVVISPEHLRVLQHEEWVNSVAFAPDDETLASADNDGTVRIWKVADGSLVRELEVDGRAPVNSVAFAPGGKVLAIGSQNYLQLRNVNGGTVLRMLPGPTNVNKVAFAPNGEILAAALINKTVQLWRVADGSLIRTLTGHEGSVDTVAFAPNGENLVSVSTLDGTVRLWRVTDGMLLHTLTIEDPTNAPESAVFAPDGQTLVVGTVQDVQFWRISDWRRTKRLDDSGLVYDLAYSSDGRIFASVYSKVIQLWQPDNYRLLTTLKGHSNTVESVAISSDGQTLASGSRDTTVRLWKLK